MAWLASCVNSYMACQMAANCGWMSGFIPAPRHHRSQKMCLLAAGPLPPPRARRCDQDQAFPVERRILMERDVNLSVCHQLSME
jgi:hypothetical protein